MNRSKVNAEIKTLKRELRAANRASDSRLLKLALIMLILAVVVAYIYGRIQL